MNKVNLIGRLTKDPDVKLAASGLSVARYTLAVDRRYKKDGDADGTDFITCITFGKNAEFAERYLHKGMKIAVFGHIQTGSYTNKDNQKVYTTDVVVEEHEFCESKGQAQAETTPANDFVNIPANVDAELPF